MTPVFELRSGRPNKLHQRKVDLFLRRPRVTWPILAPSSSTSRARARSTGRARARTPRTPWRERSDGHVLERGRPAPLV